MRPHTYCSYAKINLYLDVLKRRRDGYHNIETVFQTIDLCDRLTFEPGDGITLECDAMGLETGPGNLAYRAAALLRARTGVAQGVRIRLEKRIPIAAGLAGGSGNAATTLIALNALWGIGLAPSQLARLALELGSDVPYCLVGGTMAGTLRGEQLAPLPILPETWFVTLHPPLRLSTASVYQSPHLVRSDARPFAGRTAAFRRVIRAIERGDVAPSVYNRMETAAFALHPELAEAKQRLLDAGCLAAAMSGSGPTLFGVCADESHARAVAAAEVLWPARAVRSMPFSIQKQESAANP